MIGSSLDFTGAALRMVVTRVRGRKCGRIARSRAEQKDAPMPKFFDLARLRDGRRRLEQSVVRVEVVDVLARDDLMPHEHCGRYGLAREDVERQPDQSVAVLLG